MKTMKAPSAPAANPDGSLRHAVRSRLAYSPACVIPAENIAELQAIAGAFKMTIPQFLDAFYSRELPGQLVDEEFVMPKIGLALLRPPAILTDIAAFVGQKAAEYVLENVEVAIRSDLDAILWHPETGKPLCWKSDVYRFERAEGGREGKPCAQ